MSNYTKYIEEILERCSNNYIKTSLEEPASSIEEPFLKEFGDDFTNFLKKSKKDNILISNFEYDISIEELEELEEHHDELDFVDIEKLNELEQRVIIILQYLNLNLYRQEEIKNLIVNSVLEKLSHEKLENALKERVEEVIKHLVEHEFIEMAKKKKDRRKLLVQRMLALATPFIDINLEEHEKHKVENINTFQKQNYIKYLIMECETNVLNKLDEELDINIEERRFLKNILLVFINKKYNTKQEA